MSYEKVKRLKIANGKIIGYSTSNNVFPADWGEWTYPADEKGIRLLFKELCGYSLQPQACCKWWHELMQRPFMQRQGYYIDYKDKPTYWDERREGTWDKAQQERDYQIFREVIREKYKV